MSDISKLHVRSEPIEVVIKYMGDEYVFKVKDISWTRRNDIISKATTIDRDGKSHMDMDKYTRELLCEVLIEAPWGKTTHMELSKLNQAFGDALVNAVMSLVPEGGGAEIETLKKVPEES